MFYKSLPKSCNLQGKNALLDKTTIFCLFSDNFYMLCCEVLIHLLIWGGVPPYLEYSSKMVHFSAVLSNHHRPPYMGHPRCLYGIHHLPYMEMLMMKCWNRLNYSSPTASLYGRGTDFRAYPSTSLYASTTSISIKTCPTPQHLL